MPGVFWNTIRTPSTVTSSKSSVMTRFGAMSPMLPAATFLPIAWSTWPCGPRSSLDPYWKYRRRVMALPA